MPALQQTLQRARFQLAALTLALMAQSAVAQSPAAPGSWPLVENVAQLTASGTVEVQQDVLSITMGTTRDGADAATVQGQLKAALDTALTEARKQAQPGQLDVRTGNFSLQPRYNKDGRISGWQGSASLVLEGRDFVRISTLAGKIQTLSVNQVGFDLSREQRAVVEKQAQVLAIEQFKRKAVEVAQSFGFTRYTLREVTVNTQDNFVPQPRRVSMERSMAEAPVPVEAGTTTVQVIVSGSVQMK